MITSQQNSLIKRAVKLTEKKYRDQSGEFLIEGYRNVKDCSGEIEIVKVLVSASACEKFAGEFECEVVEDKVFARLSDTANSQGVVAIAKKKTPDQTYSDKCLFLDAVRDPGNFGTILRSAAACGFTTVFCRRCVDEYNPKVVRSSMSAIAKVNVLNCDYSVFSALKERGYTVFCADMDGNDVFGREVFPVKACLIVGNEANGVSEDAKKAADEIISLPMENMESLNVAVAATVLMYQIKFKK